MAARPIIILGMHRSGTSCLAGSLQQRGLFLGQVHESRPFNRKGNRENQQVMDLNDALLAANDACWDRPPAQLHWEPAAAMARDAIVAQLEAGSDGAPWGFKDPRTLLTLPFWRERLPHARFVGTFRNPAQVARSLTARDPSMPIQAAFDLWRAYNARLLALYAQAPFPLLDFDIDRRDYLAEIDGLVRELDLPAPGPHPDEFFDNALRTEPDAVDIAITAQDAMLHAALLQAAKASRA